MSPVLRPGPGWVPEPSAAADGLSQDLPEASALGPLHRARAGVPEEEGGRLCTSHPGDTM